MAKEKAPEFESEEEYVAYVMTLLFHSINPSIDKGLTFPIVLDLIHDGFDEATIDDWGALIRATSFDKKTSH